MPVPSGIITHIQRFSVHDGPGIRTTVFLKGCQMRCAWCHNPETLKRVPELQVFPARCIGCRACVGVCPRGAHEFGDDARHVHRRERCVACGACADTCYARALVRVGETRSAEAVAAEVLADRAFYAPSGGVTLSGGEPLVQARFARAILEFCRREGIHTALDTNLAWPWAIVAPFVPLVDLFLVDIKMMNDEMHRRWTGVSNARVLEQVRRLDALGKPLVIRTPVIVGVNDRPADIAAIAGFLSALTSVQRHDLLPYHPLGTGKYEALASGEAHPTFRAPTPAHMDALAAAAARSGHAVSVAGAGTPPSCATRPVLSGGVHVFPWPHRP